MRFIIRTVMLIALVWIGLLLSGYGVLIGSKENAAGLGLQCTYLTARGTSTVQYLHTKSGFLGITDCPLLRKSNWICPYISRHLLSLNPLQARCRRYSRGER